MCVCFVSLASCCWYFFPFLFSGLRCTQIQQRNQKREDCGMQICQCAIQLVYCYKWNTSSLVRKRKCQVLKGQPDSFWCSIPDRFFLSSRSLVVLSHIQMSKTGGHLLILQIVALLSFKLFHEIKMVHVKEVSWCVFALIALTGSCSGLSP